MTTPPPPRPDERVAILGRSETGKSVLLRDMVVKMKAENRYILIYDIETEHGDLGHLWDPRKGIYWNTRDWKQHRVMVYQPKLHENDRANLNGLLGRIWHMENFTVVIDEAHELFPQQGAMRAGTEYPWLSALSKRGRKYNISMIAATQEMAGMSKTVIRQSNHVYVMNGLLELEKSYLHDLKFDVAGLLTGPDHTDYHSIDVTTGIAYDPVEYDG